MEQSFRQAMTISDGNPSIFVGSTICVTLVFLSVLSIAAPLVLARIKALRGAPTAGEEAA
jgi:putative tricarboxylic transport membrane protein